MEWNRNGLAVVGFEGFVPFANLPETAVPRDPGVYMVLRDVDSLPVFDDRSPAGHFKDRDPSVLRQQLQDAWVVDTGVIYIGKANAGRNGRRGLRKRLEEYRGHGAGHRVGHWGGRYIWQLADRDQLLVAWRTTADEDAASLEASLLREFTCDFGVRPFANRKMGNSSR